MNSRERVITSLNHRAPDRVPVDFSGHRSSGISAIAYARLRDVLDLPKRTIYVYDPIQQLAIVDDDVLERFAIDTIELGRAFALDEKDWGDWVLPDGTPCKMPAWATPQREEARWVLRSATGRVIAAMPDGALYFEQTYWPFFERDDIDHVQDAMNECVWCVAASPPGPLADGAEGLERLARGAQQLRASSDRAIIGLFGGNLLEMGQFLYRNDRFFMLFLEDPDRAHAFLDGLVEMYLTNLERFLGAVGKHIDVILFGDDLGAQNGPQMSPDMFREFFKPRYATMWARVKQLADVKVLMHCCGGVRELIPDLIDAGLDALNPIQVACAGMDAASLKRDFGQDLTLWGGGCDTQRVLPLGTPEEVRKHVINQVRTLRDSGGFVFQQVHNILATVPPSNIIAMFDAIGEA